MADADGHATEHAKRQKHSQAHPNCAPVEYLPLGDGSAVCWHKVFSTHLGKPQDKEQQREKPNGGLQNKYNWIIEPHTVRIRVPEDKARAAGSEGYQPNAAEV